MSDQSSNRPLTSKAVTYKALGGPEVIEYVERTVRAPAAGEVRIEVKAAAVNPADLMFRSFVGPIIERSNATSCKKFIF
jgi:NADPH:quinone reductase